MVLPKWLIVVAVVVVAAIGIAQVKHNKAVERQNRTLQAQVKAALAAANAKAAEKLVPPKPDPYVHFEGHKYAQGPSGIAFMSYLDLIHRSKSDPYTAKLVKAFRLTMVDAEGKQVYP